MARQYRSMRDSLQADIDSLKAQLATAAIDHTQAESLWRGERSEWEAKLAACQALIGSERERNAELTAEFGTMLQSTLDKMGERLEVTNGVGGGRGSGAQCTHIRRIPNGQDAINNTHPPPTPPPSPRMLSRSPTLSERGGA